MNVLEAANIPVEIQDLCYISDKGFIYTPIYKDSGKMVIDGKQAYTDQQV